MTVAGWTALVGIVLVWASVVVSLLPVRPQPVQFVGAVPVVGLVIDGAFGSVTGVPVGLSIALVVGLVVLAGTAGSPFVAAVLRRASVSAPAGSHGGILVDRQDSPATGPAAADSAQREVLRGGVTIGYLERVALIGSVLAGQIAAVAVIVAVKGLGRFSELESSEARERFIIGTLASLLWAGACAWAAYLWR